MLLDLIQRPTKDIDIVALIRDGRYSTAEPLPEPLTRSVKDVAGTLGLTNDWLNSGPSDLLRFGLPDGFEIASRFESMAVSLYTLPVGWTKSTSSFSLQSTKGCLRASTSSI